ncbi:cysteine desulfurase NifS [Lottiidibacillus patelloidae]|uniref:cysteine desulfurase n=1 Tax=Lottiidibacillus patelloidae TaxID=2670334 RepID=A0A263BXH6_9BACI|nr:cysteine desulfurase family protein [Lottiidibacillus patelloidae]OZM58007.1 cysteine desulfurase NifS [Lottiidibacillus patelloidae]
MERIYVDHAATSPTHPLVIEKMIPYMNQAFGNPSSIHHFGRETRRVVDEARSYIAKSINAHPHDITFTSGGTEGDNLAIIGAAKSNSHKGKHIVTTEIEHHAVLNSCKHLESLGFSVTYLPVDETGRVSVTDLEHALTDETILVSIMYANNEVGTVQPIKEIGQLLKEHDILFHTDAVQAYGMIAIDVEDLQVDLLSISGHKINGPKGIGFLYSRPRVSFTPHFFGGEQERKRRAGTEDVPAIAGLKEAVKLISENKEEKVRTYKQYRDMMIAIFDREEIEYHINGHQEYSLPNIINVSFPGTTAESLLMNFDLAGIAASSGSACTAGALKPSHVLTAMYGENDERVMAAIRFSFGLGNTEKQIATVATKVAQIVKRITAV